MMEKLTRREREVLDLMSEGFSTNKIAGLLFISLHTVRTHIGMVMKKMGVHTRAEAVALDRKI